jgi:Tfp pilus assembly PilM family ATPase
VLLVVAPRDQVEPYRASPSAAGHPASAAPTSRRSRSSARSSIRRRGGRRTTGPSSVAIGHESSTLLVAGGGVRVHAACSTGAAASSRTRSSRLLDVRTGRGGHDPAHLSLSGPGGQYATLDEVARAKANDAVRQGLTPFARELVNSLQFYQTQTDSLGIGRILITGGTSHLEGLDGALHQMIGVDVSVGDPFARVIRAGEYDPAIEAMIGSMAVPIGLAIDEEASRGVDLLPKVTTRKRDTRTTAAKVAIRSRLRSRSRRLPSSTWGRTARSTIGRRRSTRSRFRSIPCRSRRSP